MAVDVCFSEISSPGISPRISFSYDLNQTTDADQDQVHNHHRLDSSLLDSDFQFCFNNNSSIIQELSSADELFADGKILPIQRKKPSQSSIQSRSTYEHPIRPVPTHLQRTVSVDQATGEKKLLKEFLSMSLDEFEEKPNVSKSFWQFKRSNSLNCDSTTKSKGLIRSIQFLSRSNSTGSTPKQGLTMSSKKSQKPHLQKQPSVSSRSRSSISGPGPYYPYNMQPQKPPLLRKCGSHGNGASVRISPVLNIPPPCISRGTVNLFGFGSLFCSGKAKKKKR